MTRAVAQSANHQWNREARVLDIAFSPETPKSPEFLRMILRFGDSDTQFVAVIYPDKEKYWIRRGEISRYSLPDVENGGLSQLIDEMVAQNPHVTDQEIAAHVKVNVERWPIEPNVLYDALKKLKSVRISPVLADRICVDACPEFEYWYGDGQESVHYTIVGDSKNAPQDELVQWMIKFRKHELEKLNTGTAESKQP